MCPQVANRTETSYYPSNNFIISIISIAPYKSFHDINQRYTLSISQFQGIYTGKNTTHSQCKSYKDKKCNSYCICKRVH